MSINLPANIETLSTKELMELTGQTQQSFGMGIPSLRVNYDDEDGSQNKIPRGQWALAHEGQIVYAPEVTFQPMFKTLQYSHYDNDEEKMVATSIHFQNFGDEVPDDAGGFKCGKVAKKNLDALSDAEKKVQKAIKLSQVFFGLVSLDGVNAKGVKVSVKDTPAVFYAKGSHYMPMSEFLEKLSNDNKLMQTVVIKFELKRQKNGGVTYWEVVPNIANELKPSAEMFALVRKFTETVAAENKQIIDKWSKNRNKRDTATKQESLIESLGLADTRSLDEDFASNKTRKTA